MDDVNANIFAAADPTLFTRALATERVRLHPNELHSRMKDILRLRLVDRFECRCTKHGYIKRGSIHIVNISPGHVETGFLNGDVRFTVAFSCLVCNPAIGEEVTGVVTNMNKFGVLAHAGVLEEDGKTFVKVMKIIVPKNVKSGVDLERIKLGDLLVLKILGSRFELNDAHIQVVGEALATSSSSPAGGQDAKQTAQKRSTRSDVLGNVSSDTSLFVDEQGGDDPDADAVSDGGESVSSTDSLARQSNSDADEDGDDESRAYDGEEDEEEEEDDEEEDEGDESDPTRAHTSKTSMSGGMVKVNSRTPGVAAHRRALTMDEDDSGSDASVYDSGYVTDETAASVGDV